MSEDERKEKGKKREATDDDEEEVSEDENNGTGVSSEGVEGGEDIEGNEDIEDGEKDNEVKEFHQKKNGDSDSEDFIPPEQQEELRKKYKEY